MAGTSDVCVSVRAIVKTMRFNTRLQPQVLFLLSQVQLHLPSPGRTIGGSRRFRSNRLGLERLGLERLCRQDPADPLQGWAQLLAAQGVKVLTSGLLLAYDSCLAEHPQVAGDRRAADRKTLGEGMDGHRTEGEELDDAAADGIAERGELQGMKGHERVTQVLQVETLPAVTGWQRPRQGD